MKNPSRNHSDTAPNTHSLQSGSILLAVGTHSPLNCLNPFARAILENQIVRHVERHGDGRKTHTRQLTACHEAGHLIAYRLCGYKVKEARIWKDPELGLWFGHSLTSGPAIGQVDPSKNPQLTIALAFQWMAGAAGERVFGNVSDPGSSADELCTAQFALLGVSHALGVSHQVLVDSVELYLFHCLETCQNVGSQLAKALELKRTLKRDELRRLLKPIPPQNCDVIGSNIMELSRKAQSQLAKALA